MSNRNATASWSGYSHQGHVGLLVALREINSLGVGHAEMINHYIEYETTEDVAIFYNSSYPSKANNFYLSVHQVKAYYADGGHLKSKYKSVLKDPFDAGFLNYLHTVVEITDWDNVGTANTNNIERYQYTSAILFCGVDNIQQYIITELQKILGDNISRCENVYQRLIFELDNKIREEHRIGTKPTYNIVFCLQEICDFVIDENQFVCTNIFYSRQCFYEQFQNIVKNIDIIIDEDHLTYVSDNIINVIYSLDDKDFLDFSRKINFNKPSHLLKLPQYNFNPDGLQQLFYKLLMDITVTQPILEDNLVKYIKDGTVNPYILTSIIDEEDNRKEMVKNIVTNLSSNKLLWEKHTIINKEIEGALSDLNPSIFKSPTGKQFMGYADTRVTNRTNAKQHLDE